MPQGETCLLYLTCTDEQEAEAIATALLGKQLIACVSAVPVKSWFSWKNKTECSNETLLIMKSRADLFDEVEQCVNDIHSYETFVLEMAKLDGVSSKAADWLQQTLRK